MATKHNTFSEPITPEVGQLLYNEYINDEDGSFKFGSIIFVDSPIEEGGEWYYTQIAHMEDFGNGMEVALQEEAGGMPPQVTRVATDEDIAKFITTALSSGQTKADIDQWVAMIQGQEPLLAREKERVAAIAVGVAS